MLSLIKIRCALFAGINRIDIIDHKDFDELPTEAIESALLFIKRNTREAIKIGGVRHTKVPQYPPIAVREALINAVVHADYAVVGATITVALFSDRLEITNPGMLPFGFTLEKALAGGSKLRNKVIGRVFQELELIEQWGSGLKKIVHACKEHGLPEPLFEEIGDSFRVTIYSEKISKRKMHFEGQEKLEKHLKSRKKISTKEAAVLWHVTSRTAQTRLKKLLEHGVLERIGSSAKDPRAVYCLRH